MKKRSGERPDICNQCDYKSDLHMSIISPPLTICGYPNFSLTNGFIFRENTQIYTKFVVDGSRDRTTCTTPVPVFQVV